MRGLTIQETASQLVFRQSLEKTQTALSTKTPPLPISDPETAAISTAVRSVMAGDPPFRDDRDDEAFRKACKEDTLEDYRLYILAFADGVHAREVRDRIARIQSRPKARVRVSVPETVMATYDQGHEFKVNFRWKTVFAETGRNVGYTVIGYGHIIDSLGHKWDLAGNMGGYTLEQSEIKRGKLRIGPGKSVESEYRVSGSEFCGGYAVFDWKGVDDSRNKIDVREEVSLRCRGVW